MKFNKLTILTLAIILIALLISCNTEDAGIFKQISLSVERDNVENINLILLKGNFIYAFAGNRGLGSYEIIVDDGKTKTGNWTSIKSSKVSNYTTFNDKIFYSQEVTGNVKNKLFQYDLTTKITTPLDDAYVVDMAPQQNLVVIQKNIVDNVEDAEFSVFEFDNNGSLVAENDKGKLGYTPILITATNSNKYVLTDPNDEDGIVAIAELGVHIVTISKKGQIFSDGNKKDTVSLKGRNVDHLPYPTFVYGNELYLLDSSNKFVKITDAGVVSEADQSGLKDLAKLSSVRIHSYLVDVDGDDLYVGTENSGILIYDLN